MIGERAYMNRNPQFYKGFKAQYPAVFWVLVLNFGVFILNMLTNRLFNSNFIADFLSLSLEGIKTGFVWELLSYSLVHQGLFHLLMNSLAIFFIGRFVEAKLEKRNFCILYLMGIFFGALFWLVSMMMVSPNYIGILAGASAGSFALITFFCLAMPNKSMTFLLFFVIPVTLKPRILLYILLGFELFSYITSESAGFGTVANSAHLGGIFGGYLFYTLFKINFFSNIKLSIFKPKAMKMSASDLNYSVNMVDVEELKKEANRILEKVAKKGLNSLSDKERATLKEYKDYI
ncbi:MAG: rhomboid family intramembrane serine protease [Opitutales bacterium]